MDEKILKLLSRKNYLPLNVPEMLRALRLDEAAQFELSQKLRALEAEGRVVRIKGNRYIRPDDAELIPGRITITRSGKGFLKPDDANAPDLMIPEHATLTAFNGDHVLVRRDSGTSKKAEPTGTVIRVIERNRTQFVGTLHRTNRGNLYVVPDDPRIPHDVFVPPPSDVGRPAYEGDKVVVELREWESRHVNPEGEVTEILGAPDAEGVDMLSVIRNYDLPLRFPPEVFAEARQIGNKVTPEDLKGRVDCRGHDVITIDPVDAKDFDDAFYLEPAPDGNWKLWVHVADVSHYVKPGSKLDAEAQKRGNSTYLVDRVIPMLPEALSNELCSLKPNVDRLTRCVEFLLSDRGEVLRSKFHSSVIHSKRRYSYEEAFKVLKRNPADQIEEMLHEANRIAQRIRQRRFRAGSLNLDFPETKIRLDDHGKVLRIDKVVNDISHQLIEEFMLLANEAVATQLMAHKFPAVYRVHEEPDQRRLEEFREEVISHNVICGNLQNRKEVQKLLERLSKLPIGEALKIGFLKSLMRARYAVEPLGHYGLAKDKYTHFTSPIRRYSDLVVHRVLFQKDKIAPGALRKIADHISETERNSADAERDSKDTKLYAYLIGQLESGNPQVYRAMVTDIRNFGFFVDVPDLSMSGLVPLSSIEDDFYIFDEGRNHLIGRRTRQIIRLGDKLDVQIYKVDRLKKQVDFRLAGQRPRREAPRPTSGRIVPRSRDELFAVASVRRRGESRPMMKTSHSFSSSPKQAKRKPSHSADRPQFGQKKRRNPKSRFR